MRRLPDKTYRALALVLAAALCAGAAAALWPVAEAAAQAKKGEKAAKKEPAAKTEPAATGTAGASGTSGGASGGLFTGFRRAESGGGGEKRATASAGVKGQNPFGKSAAGAAVTSTHRSRLATMETSKPSDAELAAFRKEGQLKGGS